MYYLFMTISFIALLGSEPRPMVEQSMTGIFETKEECEKYGIALYNKALQDSVFSVEHFECVIKKDIKNFNERVS